MQAWCTSFLIWNQSVVPCPVLTVASWPAYRFLKKQARWSGNPISFRIFQFAVTHTVKGFGIVNKAEIDGFLELSCFYNDPADVGNLISGSSAFSKSSLNIWKFMVHILLKPGLENFEHYFISICTPRPKLPVTPGISWLHTSAFQSNIMKRTSFLGVSFRRSCRSSLNHSTSASSALLVGA